MKAHYDLRTQPFVVGRAPGFPVELALEALQAADPLEATRLLFGRDAALRTALETASPSLGTAIAAWVAGEPLRNAKTPLRGLAYLLRMCARPTPLGLCAGIGEVAVGERTTLEVDVDATGRRTWTRPDMEYLLALARGLERSQSRGSIAYRTNACAIERGGRLFVTDVKLINQEASKNGTYSSQRPVSLKNTEAVAFVREWCREGRSRMAIVRELSDKFNAPEEAAARLVEQLIASGVLLSELQPSPIGDPVAYLLERFEALGAPWFDRLAQALDEAAALDELPLAKRDGMRYADVQVALQEMLEEPVANALQIDMRVPFAGTLGVDVLADVERYVDLCMRMSPTGSLAKLHDAFLERYEGAERLVPLLELADPSVGIRIPSTAEPKESDRSARDAVLMGLASRGMRDMLEEIELDEAEIAALAPPLPEDASPLPSIEVGFTVEAASRDAIDAGEYRIVPAGFTFGDAATRSIGRFAHMLDADAIARARALASRSDDPEAIDVEFAFAPKDDRAYNVVTRPLWHRYELCAGIGQEPSATSLDLRDFWVGFDGERMYLWSASLERRVNIRETHAFGTAFLAPDLCRLLSLLRYDGRRTVNEFDWGTAWNATYLPRLRSGRVVIVARSWCFEVASFNLEVDRKRWNLPRFVHIADEDQRLLVDLDSPIAAALIADQAGERKRMRFIEATSPNANWSRGPSGSYALEFIAQGCAAPRASKVPRAKPVPVAQRPSFGPGSAWVYGKLYLGAQGTDQLLIAHVRPFMDELREEGAIDRWFFVRYGDPHEHVRVRCRARVGTEAVVRERFAQLARRLLDEGVVWRVAFDTYAPEYERYGGLERMEIAEQIFTWDSDRVCAMLSTGIGGTDDLVAAAAAGAIGMFVSEGLEAIALEALESFAKQKLGALDRVVLRGLLESPSPLGDPGLEALLEGEGAGARLGDLIHMHCNRVGVDGPAEARVYALVRAAALGRRAKKREPLPTPAR